MFCFLGELSMDKEMKQTFKAILLVVLFAGVGYIVGSNL